MRTHIFTTSILSILFLAVSLTAPLMAADSDGMPLIMGSKKVKKLVKISDYALEPVKIAASIKTAWQLNSQLYKYDINSIAIDKKILLKGILENEIDKNLALFIARVFSNGLSLVDQLVVSRTSTDDKKAEDYDKSSDKYHIIKDLSAEAAAEKVLLSDPVYADLRLSCKDRTAYIEGNLKSQRNLDSISRKLRNIDGIDKVEHEGQITKLSFSDKMRRSWNKRKRYLEDKTPGWKDKVVEGSSKLGTKISSGAKSAGRVMSDSWITSKIRASFSVNSKVSPFRIKVRTRQGVVTLYGTAESQAEFDEAEYIAQNTSGVKQIYNQIKVK